MPILRDARVRLMNTQSFARLTLTDGASDRLIHVSARRLFLAGYTGRDRASVQRHIDELAAQGVAPPDQVPALYPGVAEAIQIEGRLAAGAGWASGEVEFVLLVTDDGIFVGIGSDHTDRERERISVVASKQAFPKIIGRRVWPLERLQRDWDRLTLRSWVRQGRQRRLYQEGVLGTMMTPADLLELIPGEERGPGLVLFSGTVPAVAAAPARGLCTFEGALLDVDGSILASCGYEYQAA